MSFISRKGQKIIIAGYIVGGPLGGLVWHHLQYVAGLHYLGFEILFVEDSNNYASCYNPINNEVSTDPTYGISFIEKTFSDFGLKDKWTYYSQHNHQWYGKSVTEVKKFVSESEVFINLSGLHPIGEIFDSISMKIFVDTDPVFTQIRNLTDNDSMHLAKKHTHFFTYGENFGKEGTSIPDDGLKWIPTRQPVISKLWNHDVPPDKNSKWTTVMQWDSYSTRVYNGKNYGMKSAMFDAYFKLPAKTSEIFELAIGSATAPKNKLLENGWYLKNPLEVTSNPGRYQNYIRESKGEWSVAKEGYVISLSGWFSERTAGYLASGRPAIVQDTGFSSFLPTGRGLFAFNSPDSVLESIEIINSDYPSHCMWAKELVHEFFHFEKVLDKMFSSV